jgi:hypothetical protein
VDGIYGYHDEARNQYQIFAYKAMEKYYEATARDVLISVDVTDADGELYDVGTGKVCRTSEGKGVFNGSRTP